MLGNNYLKNIFNYTNYANSEYRKLEDALNEFDYKYDVLEDYLIEPGTNVYKGIITVTTTSGLNTWFKKYHQRFKDCFNLKLIEIKCEEKLHNNFKRYTISYTYKDNPTVEEYTFTKEGSVK